jgi:hypothetical protein
MQDHQQHLPGQTEPETLVESDATQNIDAETAATQDASESATEKQQDDSQAKEERKAQTRSQRRWERLVRDRAEAQARAEYLEKLLEMQRQPPNGTASDGKPQPQQYATTEDYLDALTDWKLNQRERETRSREQERHKATLIERREKLLSEAEEIGDFDRHEFAETVPISEFMAEAILDSEIGAKIAVHLNAHPDEAQRIYQLAPARQAAEIGKLEAKLTSAPPKKPSAAPKPINPLQGTDSRPPGLSDSLSADEWARKRNEQLYGRR